METIATLGPSIRLVVFQFLMWERLVPRVVPLKLPSDNDSTAHPPSMQGVLVLPQTFRVYLAHILASMYFGKGGQYDLVGALRFPPRPDGKCTVSYTFCRGEYIKHDELHPDFVAKRDEIMASLVARINNNVWATKGHLNPYRDAKDSKTTGHQVLKFNCAGRESTIGKNGRPAYQYRDGRDQFNRGLGPKIPLVDLASKLKVVGDEVVLEDSELVLAQIS